jgi:hypothetical protein
MVFCACRERKKEREKEKGNFFLMKNGKIAVSKAHTKCRGAHLGHWSTSVAPASVDENLSARSNSQTKSKFSDPVTEKRVGV